MRPEDIRKKPRNWLPVIVPAAFIFLVAALSCIMTVIWPVIIHR